MRQGCLSLLLFVSNMIYLFRWQGPLLKDVVRPELCKQKQDWSGWLLGNSRQRNRRRKRSQGPGRFCLNYPDNCLGPLPWQQRSGLQWHKPREIYLTFSFVPIIRELKVNGGGSQDFYRLQTHHWDVCGELQSMIWMNKKKKTSTDVAHSLLNSRELKTSPMPTVLFFVIDGNLPCSIEKSHSSSYS